MNFLLVFLGGGLGSVVRYGMSVLFTNYYQSQLPVATFLTNVLSCLILVLVLQVMNTEYMDDRFLKPALLIGFCGGFSTFSTFSLETVQLIKNGNHLVAAGNVVLSVSVCLILIHKLTK